MKLIVKKDSVAVAKAAAQIVIEEIKRKPNLVLGLATGKTMIPFYRKLVKISKKQKVSFAGIKTFNLDEYVGFSSSNRKSFHYFMQKHFFRKVDLKKENIHFLNGSALNLKEECSKYEKKIKNCGGIDVQILGIGRNGHIAFNEPASSLSSKTRKVALTDETKIANFGSIKKSPLFALTMGISTILKSKKIILLAFGKEKKSAIQKSLHGKISSQVPASFLRWHKKVYFIIDRNVSSQNKKP